MASAGTTIHNETGINQWLEDDDRDWWAVYVPPQCPPPAAPPPPPVCTAAITVCRDLQPGEKDIALDVDCDGIPDMCDNVLDTIPDTDGDGIPDPNEDYDGDGTVNDCESDPTVADSDNDGVLDGDEDADGDGLPDWFEDVNRNCVVDPGESDPNNPDTNGDGTPDGSEDADGDNIVDWLEDDYGTSALNPDSDGDGWYDGPVNLKTVLRLVRIDTEESQENGVIDIFDAFADELFVTFNHTRWPEDDGLDGYWRVRNASPQLLQAIGVNASPQHTDVVAAVRVWSPQLAPDPIFSVRMDARENDLFDWSDDDLVLDHDIPFSQDNQIFTVNVEEENDYHHILTFTVISRWFSDPNPMDATSDADADGIGEAREFQMAGLLNGVADLDIPDIYMELDWQNGQRPERFSMEDISSRFTYRGYAFHLDEGTWGGGGGVAAIGDVNDDVSLTGPSPSQRDYRDLHFDAVREETFRYALAVEAVLNNYGIASRIVKRENGQSICGRGNDLIFEDSDFMNYFSDFESIVWIHEFGHNLGLCHLPGDTEAIVTGPGGEGGCVCCPLNRGECNCVHYSNGRWSDSAMGAGVTFPWVDDIYQAIDREIDYAESEWRAIDLRPIARVANLQNCP